MSKKAVRSRAKVAVVQREDAAAGEVEREEGVNGGGELALFQRFGSLRRMVFGVVPVCRGGVEVPRAAS